MLKLINPVPPNLPLGTEHYERRFMDQYSNVLRLYFNQLNNFTGSISSNTGGALLGFPFISATDSDTQYASGDNTATIVKWNTLEDGTAFTLNANYTATATLTGVYKITYSLQLANNDNAAHNTIVWLRVNGVDVTNSTTIFTLPARKSAGVPAYVCGYSEVVFRLYAGDSVGLWWGTDKAATSGGVVGNYIYAQAAQTSPMAYPATPSALGSITFVSSILT